MNGRKLIALLMVFALTGSGLAAQQNTYHCDKSENPNCDTEVEDVTSVQQHSVFVEIVVEEKPGSDNPRDNKSLEQHEFGAVVGLVKKCKTIERNQKGEFSDQFDNAVLWFNDQFLFGDKNSEENDIPPGNDTNVTDKGLGYQNGTSVEDQYDFVKRNGDGARWGGCYIPDGYMHAIGADDPFATGTGWNYTTAVTGNDTTLEGGSPICTAAFQLDCSDNIDFVKSLIDMDNSAECNGCIFEYHSTFFVVDPNNHRWMVDKLYYPLTVGDPFELGQTQGGNWADNSDCGDDNGADGDSGLQENSTADDTNEDAGDPADEDGQSDPANREGTDSHSSTCTDDTGDDRDNHSGGGSDTAEDESTSDYPSSSELVEPLYTTHIQVDPLTPTNQGFADKATWAYRDGTTRNGMPYADDNSTDENYESCKNNDGIDANGDGNFTGNCAIEYNFLVTVDFQAFDNDYYKNNVGDAAAYDSRHGEDEVREDYVHHGNGSANEGDAAEDGNSHPHNGNNTTGASPPHKHDAINLDLFFYESAPHFVQTNDPWGPEFGGPPVWTDDCSDIEKTSMGAKDDGTQENAVKVRTPIVCDADAGTDNFHRHDGTQTPGFGS